MTRRTSPKVNRADHRAPVYYYSGAASGGGPALLGEAPLSALELLEMITKEGGDVGGVLPPD